MSPASPSALAERVPRLLLLILIAIGAGFTAAGFAWGYLDGGGLRGGIDFSVGVALGCLLVGLNYLWTRSVVRRVIQGDSSKARVVLTYMVKFGLTVLILFLAILQFGVDPLAILVGVTSLFVAVMVAFAFGALG
jgi:hypothetical protein